MAKANVFMVTLDHPVIVESGDFLRVVFTAGGEEFVFPVLMAQAGTVDRAWIVGVHAVPMFEREGTG